MMRKPYSASNCDDPVEWLTPPDYRHAPLQDRGRATPVIANEPVLQFIVEAVPNGHTIILVMRSGGAG